MKSKMLFKFYKYQSLSQERYFDYLKNYFSQKIYLTPLKNFNDPFEGVFSYSSFTPEYILENPILFEQLLKQHHVNGQADLTADEFKKRLESPEYIDNNHKVAHNFFHNHGTLCVTTKNNNIPMWAYYADEFKGCCIQLEVDFSFIQDQLKMSDKEIQEFITGLEEGSDILSFQYPSERDEFVFAKVRYSKEIPHISLVEHSNIKDPYDKIEYIVRNSIGVKYEEWKHENEFRLILNSNSEQRGLLNLKVYAPFIKITGVIVGSLISKEHKKKVYALCKEHELEFYESSCSESSYDITLTSGADAYEVTYKPEFT